MGWDGDAGGGYSVCLWVKARSAEGNSFPHGRAAAPSIKRRPSFHFTVAHIDLAAWVARPDLPWRPAAHSHRLPAEFSCISGSGCQREIPVITASDAICQVQRSTSRSRNLHSGVPQAFILKGNVSLSYRKKTAGKIGCDAPQRGKRKIKKSGLS